VDVYCGNVARVYPGMTRAQIMAMPLVHGYQAEAQAWRRMGGGVRHRRRKPGKSLLDAVRQ
jgi:hypothetical protein